MSVTMQDRALLVKCYYECDSNERRALQKFRTVRGIRRGPMTPQGLRKMMTKFEATGLLSVAPGRGRKSVSVETTEAVALAVEEAAMDSTQGTCSVSAVARRLDLPLSTVYKIVRKVLLYYPYKIKLVQQLKPSDPALRETFALSFLARMEVDMNWPWSMMWTDEAHFYLNGDVNTHNCRIWAKEIPHVIHEIPLHSPKVTVWCGMTANFIMGPFFFEEPSAAGPVTCTVTAARLESMLRCFVIPELQQRGILDTTVFMQDGAPPHIGRCVKQLLQQHFTNDRIVARHFPIAWPPRSPDLNPCDFWLWGYLKSIVYGDNITNLVELKNAIHRHVRNISPDMLRSAVENAILRFNLLSENGGYHIEHAM